MISVLYQVGEGGEREEGVQGAVRVQPSQGEYTCTAIVNVVCTAVIQGVPAIKLRVFFA